MKKLPTLSDLEKALIQEALAIADTCEEAAGMIGISRRTIFRRMSQYGVRRGEPGALKKLLQTGA